MVAPKLGTFFGSPHILGSALGPPISGTPPTSVIAPGSDILATSRETAEPRMIGSQRGHLIPGQRGIEHLACSYCSLKGGRFISSREPFPMGLC